jgi:hypothetical protein
MMEERNPCDSSEDESVVVSWHCTVRTQDGGGVGVVASVRTTGMAVWRAAVGSEQQHGGVHNRGRGICPR